MNEQEAFQDGREQGRRDMQAEIERLRSIVVDFLDYCDKPQQEASPSWLIGCCERARAALRQKEE